MKIVISLGSVGSPVPKVPAGSAESVVCSSADQSYPINTTYSCTQNTCYVIKNCLPKQCRDSYMQWHCSPWSFFERKCNRQEIGVSKIKKERKIRYFTLPWLQVSCSQKTVVLQIWHKKIDMYDFPVDNYTREQNNSQSSSSMVQQLIKPCPFCSLPSRRSYRASSRFPFPRTSAETSRYFHSQIRTNQRPSSNFG